MARPRGKSWIKPILKTAVGLLVLVAVGRHVVRTWADLQSRGGLPRIDAKWLVWGVLLYLVGLCAYGVYFVRVLRRSQTPVAAFAGLRAYLISHLAKYVPGKAMVVVVRVGLVAPFGARPATAAFATLYETLVMMAAGGIVTVVGFAVGSPSGWPTWDVAILGHKIPLLIAILFVFAAFLVVVQPMIFPRLAALSGMPFPGVGVEALPRFSLWLLLEGLGLSAIGWIFLGLSQVAVIQALVPGGLPVAAWPTAIASVALATVAGFVVPVSPGGLGVRESVLWTSLGAVLDADMAVMASLGLRLVWVIGEVAVAAILIGIRPRPPQAVPS